MTTKKNWSEAAAASANVDATRVEVSEPYTDKFDVQLSAEDKAAVAADLVLKFDSLHAVEFARKTSADDFKARVKQAECLIDEAVDKLRTGSEKRDLEVVDHTHFSLGCIRTMNRATGEILAERALTGGERQADMFATDAIDKALGSIKGDEEPPAQQPLINLGDEDSDGSGVGK